MGILKQETAVYKGLPLTTSVIALPTISSLLFDFILFFIYRAAENKSIHLYTATVNRAAATDTVLINYEIVTIHNNY